MQVAFGTISTSTTAIGFLRIATIWTSFLMHSSRLNRKRFVIVFSPTVPEQAILLIRSRMWSGKRLFPALCKISHPSAVCLRFRQVRCRYYSRLFWITSSRAEKSRFRPSTNGRVASGSGEGWHSWQGSFGGLRFLVDFVCSLRSEPTKHGFVHGACVACSRSFELIG